VERRCHEPTLAFVLLAVKERKRGRHAFEHLDIAERKRSIFQTETIKQIWVTQNLARIVGVKGERGRHLTLPHLRDPAMLIVQVREKAN